MAGKKFRFKLATVLQLRKNDTEKAQRKLAGAMQERRAQEERVKLAEQHIRDQFKRGSANRGISVAQLRQTEALRNDAQAALQQALEQLATLLEEEKNVRKDLQDKQAAQEALEILRDKAKRQHMIAEELAESKRLEEQALDAFRRQDQVNRR